MSGQPDGPANRGKNRPLPPVETRFKPGQSGNISGRPRGAARLSTAYREILDQPFPDDPEGRTWAQVIAVKLARAAVNGDVQAARELADRVEGKAASTLEIGGALGLAALPPGISVGEYQRIQANPGESLRQLLADEHIRCGLLTEIMEIERPGANAIVNPAKAHLSPGDEANKT